jgi:hypothetical protein
MIRLGQAVAFVVDESAKSPNLAPNSVHRRHIPVKT